MIWSKTIEEAFTGLEAAIVLIAFIIVAAVFSFVVLGSGFMTTQKAQETVHTGVQQTTSGVQPSGQISVQADAAGTGVANISFYLQLAAGGTGADMKGFSFAVSTPNKIVTYAADDVTYDWVKEVSAAGSNHGAHTGVLNPHEMVSVTVPGFDATAMGVNTKFLVEVKPPIGAAVPLGATVPGGMNPNIWYDVY